jgi:hypothetical protein
VERGSRADVDRIRPEHGSNTHIDLVHAGVLELESSDTARGARVESGREVY